MDDKVTLKLNVKRSTTVQSSDGTYYKLNSGKNVLRLTNDAYIALSKTLGLSSMRESSIKPLVESTTECNNMHDACTEDSCNFTCNDECCSFTCTDGCCSFTPNKIKPESTDVISILEQVAKESKESHSNNTKTPSEIAEDNLSSLSYAKLKAMYKEVTGKSCKLKRDELLKFLQEHKNAE